MSDIEAFEKNMRAALEDFTKQSSAKPQAKPQSKPQAKPRPRSKPAGVKPQGTVVTLAVRQRQLQMDTRFEYTSSSISRLEARLEAEKAAKEAGYPIIGYVIDIKPL